MKILAIETSCDETALAVLGEQRGFLYLEKNLVYSQVNIHKKYGGVVPEVASRKHLETIIPLLDHALGKNKLKKIDYLAFTQGPGLVTSLVLGVATAKALSLASNKPLVPVNHLEGHIYSNWLTHKELQADAKKYFPSVIAVVSGGHTELILMTGHGQYQLLGRTLDDAVGEAFDKVAKLLGLGYPGGPIVSKLATVGNAHKYDFPRPMINSHNFDFSLSGLKTAILYFMEKKQKINQQDVADICAGFQLAVTEVLVKKTFLAAKKYKAKSIMLAGGVSANTFLKQNLKKEADKLALPFFPPDLKFTGDNAAMIGAAAYYQIKNKQAKVFLGEKAYKLEPLANWQLVEK
ncbi:MAG: tRNA (adenosine(37)-N6)-threonylcarbamoyltransferase complex transferase subunit TsaD [Patescibacteria group bacterium]|jgi:N6-L-threonylcarbamoyladenine synthase